METRVFRQQQHRECADAPNYVFVADKRKLRKHTKSRGGCTACKTRKVKCSETLPKCTNCLRLGSTCAYLSTASVSSTTTSSSDSEQQQQLVPVRSSSNVVPNRYIPASTESPIDLVMPPTIDGIEFTGAIESLRFINTQMMPEIAPAHAPFQRRLFGELRPWLYAPRTIRLSLIVLAQTLRASRFLLEPALDQRLCLFRGILITELMTLLKDSDAGNHMMVFNSIQLLMLAEMQLEPLGPWAYHLEAARRLLKLSGGLGSLFYNMPMIVSTHNVLIVYLEIDIMTSTTSSVSLLNPSDVAAQSSYIPLLAHREGETITTPCFSPIQLMSSIADINKLRVRCSQPITSTNEPSARQAEFDRIHAYISEFEPHPWADRILNHGIPLPRLASSAPSDKDTEAMVTLAKCHQATATLYLHLSCNPSPLPKPRFLHDIHRQLTANLADLVAQYSPDTNGPNHTQLYKFAIWPLVVAAYARVGWDLGGLSANENNFDSEDYLDSEYAPDSNYAPDSDYAPASDPAPINSISPDDDENENEAPLSLSPQGPNEGIDRDLQRLAQVAAMIGSRPLRTAVDVMEDVKGRRAARGGGAWGWDEAFPSRCSFCVL